MTSLATQTFPGLWSPWTCADCSISVLPAGPLRLCPTHEQQYASTWQPEAVTRAQAVLRSTTAVDLTAVHRRVLADLQDWVAAHRPAVPADLAAVVERALLANVQRTSATAGVVHLTPVQVRRHATDLTRPSRELQERAATGTLDYRCSAAAGLAWKLSGVRPEVANVFEDRVRGDGPTVFQPVDQAEVDEPLIDDRFLGWSTARQWRQHLHGGQPSSDTLEQTAAHVTEHERYLLRPSSIETYLRRSFLARDARSVHAALVDSGLVQPDGGAVRVAVRWRDYGFDLPSLRAWLGSLSALHDEPRRVWDPWANAALREAGFTSLWEALPWLRVWDECPTLTPAELYAHHVAGTPPEWVASFESGPSTASAR